MNKLLDTKCMLLMLRVCKGPAKNGLKYEMNLPMRKNYCHYLAPSVSR